MDGTKFDKLTRAFATGTDRRTLLKLLGGATVAGVAGVKIAAPAGVFAQGTVAPGGVCTADADCTQGTCVIQGDPGAEGICACTPSGLGDPWAGCVCTSGTQDPCGDSGYECCDAETEGGEGTCAEACEAVLCSPVGESCEATDCCIEGDCGANGWCTGCYSGTEDPCAGINEAFDANYICCTADGAAAGSLGYCTEESLCVSETPNTGSGATADANSWIAPAAAIGAAAAVMAYKSREARADTEA